MKRLMGWILGVCLILGALPLGVSGAAVEITAPSAILMDAATGTVLLEENADERLAPASVTKIMTLLLVMEALDAGQLQLTDTISASETAAAKGGSQVYLEPGEQMSVDEMLKSVVVSSANDCATALAEAVAGSESAFVDKMNAKAQELGMENTFFVNCTGLDDGENASQHLTTARDIAIMSRELLRHDTIRNYTTIWMDTVRDGKFGLANTNKLVRFYEGATGLKTGFTSGAGYCLSASAQRDGMELIAVVLHCESSTDRFSSAKALLDYGFANYALLTPDLDVTLPAVPVTLGAKETATPVLADSSKLLIDKAKQAQIERKVTLEEALQAPVAQGQQIGALTISAGGETIKEIPLVAQEDIPKLTFRQVARRLISSLAMGGG